MAIQGHGLGLQAHMDKTLAGSDSECLLVSVGACMSDLGRGACMGRPGPRTCLRQTWWDLRRSISVFLTSCIVGEDREFLPSHIVLHSTSLIKPCMLSSLHLGHLAASRL
jgi:hypothetical protein